MWKEGKWTPEATVNDSVKARVDKYSKTFSKLKPAPLKETISQIEAARGWEWILKSANVLPSLTDDHEGLRDFLIRHKAHRSDNRWGTQYGKAAVAYDWMRYGAA